MKNKACIISTTCDSKKLASKMAKDVIEKRLAACVHIIPNIQSIYRWQGKIETASEFLVQFKTISGLADGLMEIIKEQHSYDTPEILSTGVDRIDSEYHSWLIAATNQDLA